MTRRMTSRLYMGANAFILGGFVALCQPVSVWLYSAGFPVLVAGVVLHIVLDHVPVKHDGGDDGPGSGAGAGV